VLPASRIKPVGQTHPLVHTCGAADRTRAMARKTNVCHCLLRLDQHFQTDCSFRIIERVSGPCRKSDRLLTHGAARGQAERKVYLDRSWAQQLKGRSIAGSTDELFCDAGHTYSRTVSHCLKQRHGVPLLKANNYCSANDGVAGLVIGLACFRNVTNLDVI